MSTCPQDDYEKVFMEEDRGFLGEVMGNIGGYENKPKIMDEVWPDSSNSVVSCDLLYFSG